MTTETDPKAKASGATPTLTDQIKADPGARGFFRQLAAFVRVVKEKLDSLTGFHDPLDAAVTWRTLANLGLLEINGSGKKVWKGGILRIGNATIGQPSGIAESTPPPAPTGFAASAALSNSILSWTEPDYGNHDNTEVWRNTTDSLTGAIKMGVAKGSVYVDPVGVSNGIRYYWVRHVSTAGIIGPYNATAGTANTTAKIAAADITDLCITNALIASNAAIDGAKIASLEAGKITAGTIGAHTINLNGATSILQSQGFSAGSAGWQIKGDGDAEFNNVTVRGTINASDITAGTLDVDRILGGAIDTIKLTANSVTEFDYDTDNSATGSTEFNLLGSGVSVSVTLPGPESRALILLSCRVTCGTASDVIHTVRVREGSMSGTVVAYTSATTYSPGNQWASIAITTIEAPGEGATEYFFTGNSASTSTYQAVNAVVAAMKR